MTVGNQRGFRVRGIGMGLVVTLGVCGLFAFGALNRFYHFGLDLHFRYLGSVPADSRVVLIPIDDRALTTVDRYPWPRRRFAQLIEILHELGAERIVLDVILAEPSVPRLADAEMDRFREIESELPVLGEPSPGLMIYDDDELADSMRRAGNVYLAMFFPMAARPPDSPLKVWLGHCLTEDFSLTAEVLALRADKPGDGGLDAVEAALPEVKRQVGLTAARKFLEVNPKGTWFGFFAQLLPNRSFETLTADRADLRSAFLLAQAEHAALRKSPAVSGGSLPPTIPDADGATLPLARFAEAAKGIGFVSFLPDRWDGVIRELPLIGRMRERAIFQLGAEVAADVLQIDRSQLAYEKGRLRIGMNPHRREIPCDAESRTLINWHVPGRNSKGSGFVEIPAGLLMTVPLNREGLTDNARRLRIRLGELVEFRHAETKAHFAQYANLVNERLQLTERRPSTLFGITEMDGALREPSQQVPGKVPDTSAMNERIVDLDTQIQQFEEESVVWLRRIWGLWEGDVPDSYEDRAMKEKVRAFYEDIVEGRLESTLARANEILRQKNSTALNTLEPAIQGKTCVVGFTASAVADLVTTPASSSVPGVVAHANVINMILQDKPAIAAPLWINVLLVLFVGLVVTTTTSGWKPMFGLVTLIVVTTVVLVGSAFLFWIWTIHVGSVVAVLAAAATWACVTLFRQLVAERSRREFQRALAQYTSPAVANQIAESRGAEAMIPRPAIVTCFFADLADFTRLSERLGPEKTRRVLNPYLTAMSKVLIEHHALVNKFMGDGVFAFFNPPIWPCERHAEWACASALSALEALAGLNARRSGTVEHGFLSMRIGLSTGEAFVGDYGSDSKLDYTCIGDTVNLGSRLEGANRALGTTILVDEATRNAAEGPYFFRRLGSFFLPGKSQSIDISELLGRTARIDPADRAFVDGFHSAVALFQCCQWGKCLSVFAECERLRPGDRTVRRYLDEVERRRSSASEGGQGDALVLTLP